MTFEEATRLKKEIPNKYSERGFPMVVYIVPAKVDELIIYLKDFEERNFTDEDAKQFSKTDDYSLNYREIINT